MGNKTAPLVFTGSPLDRAGEKRGDADWLAEKRAESTARVLLLRKLQPLLTGPGDAAELRFVNGTAASGLGGADAEDVFLGTEGGCAYFARDISAMDDQAAGGLGGHFRDVRSSLSVLPVREVAILGQAKALIDWHARHKFCSACGAATAATDGGYRRHCRSCGADHFPRTDPAVIMLAIRGERCLLARNKRFSGSNYHSALAGFVEPGEAIEEAVRREVFEEVGLRIGAVHYVASQPWPFPASLMIGCFAEAESEEIAIDGSEIIAARWFSRADISRMLAGEQLDNVTLPRREAIAFHLIKRWAETE